MRRAVALILLLPFAVSAALVRVDSRTQGRTFIVDTDRAEIRKALREAAVLAAAMPLPEWLPAYPGATIVPRARQEMSVSYRTSASPDAVLAHYESALRAARINITYINRAAGRGGSIHCEDGARRASVSVSPGVGPTDIIVNWSAKTIPVTLAPSARLETVWYDDDKEILRLRDAATGKEYELDMPAMLRYAKSQPLEASARADFPAWMIEYPGATVIVATGPPAGWKPQKFIDMRSFNLEMETPASPAQVAAFYRETMKRFGLTIERETQSSDWAYSFQARNHERDHEVLLDVLKRAKDTHIRLQDSYTLPR